jgi:hypothetical protein
MPALRLSHESDFAERHPNIWDADADELQYVAA